MVPEFLEAVTAEVISKFSDPEKSALLPAPRLLGGVFDALKSFLSDKGPPLTSSAIRAVVNQFMAQTVRDLTGADCVFVRRLNTDGSVELISEPTWYADIQVGRPPTVKRNKEGVSATVLGSGEKRPVVVWNINDPSVATEYRQAHAATLSRWSEDAPEHAFTAFIQSEICVPLVVKGQVLAGIVAVSGQPIPPERADGVRQILTFWQEILTSLYVAAMRLEQEGQADVARQELTRLLPAIASTPSDEVFLRKVSTVLTCGQGMRWQRAMLFLFRDQYPADADCVIAVGGTGDTGWSEFQATLTMELGGLDEYMRSAESPEFGRDDMLYQLSQQHAFSITKERLQDNAALDALLSGHVRPNTQHSEGGLRIACDNEWLSGIESMRPAFQDLARECEHIIFPLVWKRAIGFVLLDNPYLHPSELSNSLAETRLICDLFAANLNERGMLAAPRWTPREGRFLLEQPISAERYLKSLRTQVSSRDVVTLLIVVEFSEPISGKDAPTIELAEALFCRVGEIGQSIDAEVTVRSEAIGTSNRDSIVCCWFPSGLDAALRAASILLKEYRDSQLAFKADLRLAIGGHEYAAFCCARRAEQSCITLDPILWEGLDTDQKATLSTEGVFPPDDKRIKRQIQRELDSFLGENSLANSDTGSGS